MRFIRRLFYTILLGMSAVAALAGYYAYRGFQHRNPDIATLEIPKGSSVRTTSYELEKRGVIRDQFVFEAFLRLTGDAGKIKAGEYEFEAGLDMKAVVEKLVTGKVKLRQVTIPEGYAVRDVCRVLSEKKITDAPTCANLTRTLKLVPEGARSLEGFLFPDTYSYDAHVALDGLLRSMTELFGKKVGAERIARAKAKGLSLHELVTFASVVEKETGLARERPKIAGVFFNRLKLNMPLQSDPTVIYGLPDFGGNLTRADLTRDTPYNTYTRPGLPAGPICNPGLGAIDAVLDPEPTDALYFVAKGDGSHYFSATLDQHNAAVRYYQLHQGAPPAP